MAKQGLELDVRRMENLYHAFTTVRSNINAGGRREFKAKVQEISKNPFPYLKRLQTDLRTRKFGFRAQQGITKGKAAHKKRPLVVSPVKNRIVQRAILNVLQSEEPKVTGKLGDIGATLRAPTSVGGVPGRGVRYGIDLVNKAIESGATHFVRSDIQAFFTKVPKSMVVGFVRDNTKDDDFVQLLRAALDTELENAREIKDWLHLFPLDDVGIPQGSSLSAFAGNVVLRDFDQRLNGRGVCTVRYIDDFVTLAGSGRDARAAFGSAEQILGQLGMKAYTPDEDPRKSKIGLVSEGFDFLGCSIRSNGVSPSRASKKRFLGKLKQTLNSGLVTIRELASSADVRRAEGGYLQVLSLTDRIIRGWGDSLSFADQRLAFHQLDREIDALVRDFKARAGRYIRDASDDRKRRALGIALLKDTPYRPA